MMLYDPFEHAAYMGIPVRRAPLKEANGIWVPSLRVIWLSETLPPWAEVPILAHECVHAEYNDPGSQIHEHEARADRVSAMRLMSREQWQEIYASDDGTMPLTNPQRAALMLEYGIPISRPQTLAARREFEATQAGLAA